VGDSSRKSNIQNVIHNSKSITFVSKSTPNYFRAIAAYDTSSQNFTNQQMSEDQKIQNEYTEITTEYILAPRLCRLLLRID